MLVVLSAFAFFTMPFRLFYVEIFKAETSVFSVIPEMGTRRVDV